MIAKTCLNDAGSGVRFRRCAVWQVMAGIRDGRPCGWLAEFLARRRAVGKVGYRALAAALREDIRDERLAAGAKLPPQRELARMLGVGRTTVMGAYNVLQGERLIRASHGAGTWVVERPIRSFPQGGSGVSQGGSADLPPPDRLSDLKNRHQPI
jgi:regulatory GntR family protein